MNSKQTSTLQQQYLDLLKKSLTDYIHIDRYTTLTEDVILDVDAVPSLKPLQEILPILEKQNVFLHHEIEKQNINKIIEKRKEGLDWPKYAQTMIGTKRIESLQKCIEDVLENNIKGDLIETGAWRGGATIFMRGVLKAYGVEDRCVWVADSFEGLPKPDKKYIHDKGDKFHTSDILKVSLDEVINNFKKYDLLDDNVKFLKGWFEDTLPTAPIEKLAILRLDGDMYSSTITALDALYAKVSIGGYIIVDDYTAFPACKAAITDFRHTHSITDKMLPSSGGSVYWKKTT